MTSPAPADPAPVQSIESYLSQVTAALPGPARARAGIVAELRGGLLDATDAHGRAGLAPPAAAQAAVAEFGHPAQVAAAFGPGLAATQARHVAATLLVTGPLVGLLWAAAARASHIGVHDAPPWQWAGTPPAAPIAFPLMAVVFLITVWTALITLCRHRAAHPLAPLPPPPRPHHRGHRRVRRRHRRRGHPHRARQPARHRPCKARSYPHRPRRRGQHNPAYPRPPRRAAMPHHTGITALTTRSVHDRARQQPDWRTIPAVTNRPWREPVDAAVAGLAMAALVADGILAGLSLDKVIVQLPARRRIGVTAYAAYARAADLGNGIAFYAAVGVGAAVLTVAAFAVAVAVGAPAAVTGLLAAAALLSLVHSAMTARAAPTMFQIGRAGDDQAAMARLLARFARWSTARAAAQTATLIVVAIAVGLGT